MRGPDNAVASCPWCNASEDARDFACQSPTRLCGRLAPCVVADSPNSASIAVHREPIWRDRADFIAFADISESDVAHREQLWVRKVRIGIAEICCVPFFVYGVSLGDLVSIDSNGRIRGVVQESGRYVFRVYVAGHDSREHDTLEGLQALGAGIEWSSRSMYAVDAVSLEAAQAFSAYLEQRDAIYETGR